MLLTAYILLLIFAFALQTPALLAVYLVACMAYVLATVHRVATATRAELTVVVAVLVSVCVFLVAGIPRTGLSALAQAIVAGSAVLAAFGATRNAGAYLSSSRWGLVVAQAIIALYLVRVGISGFPLENLIPGHSSNGITSYLVALQVNYCVADYTIRRRLPWVTMLVTLGICLVGFGRGSILASTALLVLSLATEAVPQRGRSTLLRLAVVALALAAIVAFHQEIALFADANTKIGAGLVDQSRSSMIADYVGHLNPITALIGGDYDHTVIRTEYNGNPHNSFIRAHHTFGLIYLMVIALLPVYVVLEARLTRSQRLYVLSSIFVLYFRAFTEPILFPTVFDFFYFGMCFIVLRGRVAHPARRTLGAPAVEPSGAGALVPASS